MNASDVPRLSGTLAELAGLLGLNKDLLDRRRLWTEARRLVRERSGDQGHLWAAIGLDYRPCSMGCKFCSFAQPWTAIRDCSEMSFAEVERWARRFVAEGADYLVLRTSELYPAARLADIGRRIRTLVPPALRLVANTSLLNPGEARELRDAGFTGVYKTIRVREGIDTPFDPPSRLANIEMAKAEGLESYALVEPVGPEHTAAELAAAVECLRDSIRPVLIGAMARVPVAGSPLERFGRVDETFLADLTALLVLALLPALPAARLVCSHPASPLLTEAGANAYVCEVGAVPRDARYVAAEWSGFSPSDARRLLTAQGCRFA